MTNRSFGYSILLAATVGLLVSSGCGGSDQSTASKSPPASTAKAWPTKWCQAHVGMSRDELRKLMGPPTEEYTPANTPSGFEPQMIWDAYEWHFTAFFNADDHVRALDMNTRELTGEEKAALACSESRS